MIKPIEKIISIENFNEQTPYKRKKDRVSIWDEIENNKNIHYASNGYYIKIEDKILTIFHNEKKILEVEPKNKKEFRDYILMATENKIDITQL